MNSVKSVVPCYPAPLIPSAGSHTAQQGTSCADIAAAAIHRGNILYHHIRSACPPHPFCLPKKENIILGLSDTDVVCNNSNHPKVSNRPICVWESYVLDFTAELIIPFDQWVQVGDTIGKYSEVCVKHSSSNIIVFISKKKLVIGLHEKLNRKRKRKSETRKIKEVNSAA